MSDSIPMPTPRPAATPSTEARPAPVAPAPTDESQPFDGMLEVALDGLGDSPMAPLPLPAGVLSPVAELPPLPPDGKGLPVADGLPAAWNTLFLNGAQGPAPGAVPLPVNASADTENVGSVMLTPHASGSTNAFPLAIKGNPVPVDGVFAQRSDGLIGDGAFAVAGTDATGNLVTRGDSAPLHLTPAQTVSPLGGERGLPTAGTVNVPPQHPQWGQAVGERVQWMIGQQLQQAEIRLDPPELGSLDVKVMVNKDHATVHFVTHNPQVRDALEAAAPRLREMFAEAGLNLGDVNVSQESFHQAQGHEGRTADGQAGSPLAEGTDEGLSAGTDAMAAGTGQLRRIGLLDTYA